MVVPVTLMAMLCACSVARRTATAREEYFPAHKEGSDSDSQGVLMVLTATPEAVEAVYRSPDGRGIDFQSEKYGDAQSVTVRNNHGKIILEVIHPSKQSTLVTAMSDEFLLVHSPYGKTEEYTVPPLHSPHVRALVQSGEVPDEYMLSKLEEATAETRERVFGALLGLPEMRTIKEASFALGESGVTGTDSPAALVFYAIAMRLTQSVQEDSNDNVPAHEQGCGWFSSGSRCGHNDACCKKCPKGSQCLGMCGPVCSPCWWFACGDCCYHQGCYDHDVCCRKYGFVSVQCLVPVGFSCSSYKC